MNILSHPVTRFSAIALIGTLASFISIESTLAKSPERGDQALDFELTAVAGQAQGTVKLSETAAKKRVILVVLRGFPGYQCGICSRQVGQLIAKAEQFQAKGVDVLMVYPGPAPQLEKRAEEFLKDSKLPAPFTLLVDPDYTFTNAYGLRWDAPNETAYPSTFVIDTDSKIQFAKISKEHGGRTSADEILSQL